MCIASLASRTCVTAGRNLYASKAVTAPPSARRRNSPTHPTAGPAMSVHQPPWRPPPALWSPRSARTAPPPPSAIECAHVHMAGPKKYAQLNGKLRETCAAFLSHSRTLEEVTGLQEQKLAFLSQRTYAPDTNRTLEIQLVSARAELAECKRIMSAEAQKHQALFAQHSKLQWSHAVLQNKCRHEVAAREQLERERMASRLQLLVRLAKANSECNALKRERANYWGGGGVAEESPDPRDEPGYRDAFSRDPGAAPGKELYTSEPPESYYAMFASRPGGDPCSHAPKELPASAADVFVRRPPGMSRA